ncbi:MAG: DNA-methyltransferase [Oscillospiraceae bacterium]
MPKTVIVQDRFERAAALLAEILPRLPADGNVFVLCSTEYDEQGNVRHDFLDVIRCAADLGYQYINTIVYPTPQAQRVAFADNVRYVVWLCRDHRQVAFDKDAIREKHIWKDVEWGKREKNYNPKGKDPGNVWIPTLDDGRAHITEHILLSDEQVVERLLRMSACGGDHELHLAPPPPTVLSLPQRERLPLQAPPRGRVLFSSSEDMSALADGSVSAAVTSPPYWDLKDYFKAGQIGQEPYPDYLCRMETVWRNCYDKLADDGSLWININIRVREGRVVLIPHDFVRICRELGFFYKGIFLWHKSSGIPTGDKNIVDRHEYVLLFSKRNDFTVDFSAQSGFADYKNPAINGGAFWNINRKAGSVGKKTIHPAIYPNALVERIVRLSTAPGALVLDPFLGSGTTLIAALQSGRSCVGYEYNEGFQELMRARFDSELGHDAPVDFVR